MKYLDCNQINFFFINLKIIGEEAKTKKIISIFFLNLKKIMQFDTLERVV